MLSIPSQEEREKSSVTPMDIEFDSMSGLTPGQITSLIKCCVDLISVPVECETLHAVLRLCLRFTREHEEANLFVDCGGVDQLLALTQASFFTGFTSLCTLLLRHVLEDKSTLAQCMTMVSFYFVCHRVIVLFTTHFCLLFHIVFKCMFLSFGT